MKIMTVLGTRPEIIRLSRVVEKLGKMCEHILVHTGQNFDVSLSELFFQELGVSEPRHFLGIRGESFGEQVGKIMAETERVMLAEKPDRLLILGDTNSGLSAVIAKRLGIPVYHMEAGNRCYDDRVPEEVNRRIIDHSSDVLLPYTERSRANLLREGIPADHVYVTGNPIHEVLQHHDASIEGSCVLQDQGLEPKQYFLVTMHRAENVDVESRLLQLTRALERIHIEFGLPVIVSTHPRTRGKMGTFGIDPASEKIRYMEPFGLFDFVKLEKNAACVLTDSGTVQEECCIFGVPNVTIRDVTERPETLEVGSNILTGADPDTILRSVRMVLDEDDGWRVPPEYRVENVSGTVVKILLGYRHIR